MLFSSCSQIFCFNSHLNRSRFNERKQIDIIVCYPSPSVKYPVFDFNRFSDFSLQVLLQLAPVVVNSMCGLPVIVLQLIHVRIAIFFFKNNEQLAMVAQTEAGIFECQTSGSAGRLRGILGPVGNDIPDLIGKRGGKLLRYGRRRCAASGGNTG